MCSLWHMSCWRPLVVPSDTFGKAWTILRMPSVLQPHSCFCCRVGSLGSHCAGSWRVSMRASTTIRASAGFGWASPLPLPQPWLAVLMLFWHQLLREHWLSNSALGWVLWTVQEKQKPRFLLLRRKTHTWQMTAWSRPRGPLVLKEGSNSICRMGWGWFKEEVAVHLQEEASPEIISFRYVLS